ncbi:hypothetical protein Y032_0015g2568 [Ancylostoma ceylanicum]|uniref:Uncharacterized protein n=1 Tax=Ancylostoma ceylanicum TaxID=53326 RepID=A0A016V7M2_9BILA|nr:hypothetical protein Y032_0015g2568 [Ancylostoma ceylanicum]
MSSVQVSYKFQGGAAPADKPAEPAQQAAPTGQPGEQGAPAGQPAEQGASGGPPAGQPAEQAAPAGQPGEQAPPAGQPAEQAPPADKPAEPTAGQPGAPPKAEGDDTKVCLRTSIYSDVKWQYIWQENVFGKTVYGITICLRYILRENE